MGDRDDRDRREDDRRDDDRQRDRDRGSDKSTGVALRWNTKGFGFIKPDDGGEDVFCHFSSILDGKMLKEGSKVEFVKQYDERKGKDRAEEVTGGVPEEEGGFGGGGGGGGRGGPGGVSGPPPEGKVQGLALRWSEKGFGFIKPDDGGEDLFCHFSQIDDGNALKEGTTVHFVKQYDEMKGKDRAVQVVGGIQEERGGGGGGYGGGGGGYGGGGGGYEAVVVARHDVQLTAPWSAWHCRQALLPTPGGSRPQLGIASRGPSGWDDDDDGRGRGNGNGGASHPINDVLYVVPRALWAPFNASVGRQYADATRTTPCAGWHAHHHHHHHASRAPPSSSSSSSSSSRAISSADASLATATATAAAPPPLCRKGCVACHGPRDGCMTYGTVGSGHQCYDVLLRGGDGSRASGHASSHASSHASGHASGHASSHASSHASGHASGGDHTSGGDHGNRGLSRDDVAFCWPPYTVSPFVGPSVDGASGRAFYARPLGNSGLEAKEVGVQAPFRI